MDSVTLSSLALCLINNLSAFILYRQRHQAEILAQNPGLPNPEISKIAGELWKAESESVKNEWKLLAEVRCQSLF